jgi:hypothetical protein
VADRQLAGFATGTCFADPSRSASAGELDHVVRGAEDRVHRREDQARVSPEALIGRSRVVEDEDGDDEGHHDTERGPEDQDLVQREAQNTGHLEDLHHVVAHGRRARGEGCPESDATE